MFTDSLKWDLFVIYIFTSVFFVGSCGVLVCCMFLFSPAKAKAGLKKTKRNVQVVVNRKRMSHQIISLNTNSNKELTVNQRPRSVSFNVSRQLPHFEDATV